MKAHVEVDSRRPKEREKRRYRFPILQIRKYKANISVVNIPAIMVR